jgi:hypothetical protein
MDFYTQRLKKGEQRHRWAAAFELLALPYAALWQDQIAR